MFAWLINSTVDLIVMLFCSVTYHAEYSPLCYIRKPYYICLVKSICDKCYIVHHFFSKRHKRISSDTVSETFARVCMYVRVRSCVFVVLVLDKSEAAFFTYLVGKLYRRQSLHWRIKVNWCRIGVILIYCGII